MEKENVDNVLDYRKLANGYYIVKFWKDDGLEGDNNMKKTITSHLGAFILSKSIRIMNKFISELNGFYNNGVSYGDIDSLYVKRLLGRVG